VYVDQYSGDVLAEAGWHASYGALAKGTAWGVDTHMGRQFGLVNGLAMGGSCLAVIGSTITAPLMLLELSFHFWDSAWCSWLCWITSLFVVSHSSKDCSGCDQTISLTTTNLSS
jgi:hypothetical protein